MQTSTAASPAPVATLAPLPFQLGQLYPDQGGIYAGIVRAPAGQKDWHLFVATDPAATFDSLAWGGYGDSEKMADSANDGFANTQALVASHIDHPAAEACRAVTIDGLSDFYLPARGELAIAAANVPELFSKDDWYWSSTQFSADNAWIQYGNGNQFNDHKGLDCRVRACRRLVIQ